MRMYSGEAWWARIPATVNGDGNGNGERQP